MDWYHFTIVGLTFSIAGMTQLGKIRSVVLAVIGTVLTGAGAVIAIAGAMS